jgi:hypothetical protein
MTKFRKTVVIVGKNGGKTPQGPEKPTGLKRKFEGILSMIFLWGAYGIGVYGS